jgi:hypothetical protein
VESTAALALAAIRHLPKLRFFNISLREEWTEADKKNIRDILAQKEGGKLEHNYGDNFIVTW